MQVSGDGVVRLVNSAFGNKKEGQGLWYRVNLCDEEGEVVSCYCNEKSYKVANQLSFGTEVTPVFRLSSGNRGMFVTLEDIITGR